MSTEHAPEVPPMVAAIRPLWKAAKQRLGTEQFMEQYVDFAQQLRNRYSDAKHRRAYHALIGSTMAEGERGIIEEDFPGADSVIRFLKSLVE